MEKIRVEKICPSCGNLVIMDEISSEQGEFFTNCDKCGYFKQKMVKSCLKDIDKVKQTYPKNIEDDEYLTVESGGFGTWQVVQKTITHSGSFVDNDHINDFLKQIKDMFDVEDVIEITYNVVLDGEWKETIITKNK